MSNSESTKLRVSDTNISPPKSQSIKSGEGQIISPRSMSSGDIEYENMSLNRYLSQHDVQVVSQSLSYMNPFQARRANEKQQLVFMREVLANGEIASFEISLRQLLGCVNNVADSIDTKEEGRDMKSFASFSSADLTSLVKPPSLVSSAIDKQSAAIHLRVRDLRRLDFNFNPKEEPSIWVRRHAVMFSVDPIRAIIMGSRIVIVVPPGGMDQILDILERYMREWTKDNNDASHHHEHGKISFEGHAFEAILATTNTLNSQEYKVINEEAQDVLSYFNTKSGAILPYAIQEKMRTLKNSIFRLQSKITSLRRALSILIDDDEAMALMNLSRLRSDPSLYSFPLSKDILSAHEEIEELLESHLMDCNSLGEKLAYLMVTMQNAEDLMSLKLDTNRNELLMANTTLTIATVAIGFSAYVTGVYGMNLDQTITIQNVYGLFETVFAVTFALIFIITALIWYYYKRTGVLPSTIKVRHHVN